MARGLWALPVHSVFNFAFLLFFFFFSFGLNSHSSQPGSMPHAPSHPACFWILRLGWRRRHPIPEPQGIQIPSGVMCGIKGRLSVPRERPGLSGRGD